MQADPSLHSFDVAEQSHTPQDPELWRKWSLQVYGGYVVHVGPHWFLVNGTRVEAGILHTYSTTKTRLFISWGQKTKQNQRKGFQKLSPPKPPEQIFHRLWVDMKKKVLTSSTLLWVIQFKCFPPCFWQPTWAPAPKEKCFLKKQNSSCWIKENTRLGWIVQTESHFSHDLE